MPQPSDWITQLRELLCKMYQEWGGDCQTLPGLVPDQIATLWAEFEAFGAPSFPNQEEKDEYLGLLSDTSAHLNMAENSLLPADTDSLRNLIAAIGEALEK